MWKLIKTKICSLFTWIISITISNTGISGMTTVLYPAKINITVGVSGDAGVSGVEIFIYVWIEDRVEINKAFITGWSDGSKDALVLEPLHQLRRPHRVVDYAFNVVRYQHFPQVPDLKTVLRLHLVLDVVDDVYLQHALRAVIRDAVALQHVLHSAHLPGQPPLLEGGVDAEHVREVAGVTAATALVILYSFLDSLHLPLLAVSPSELQSSYLNTPNNQW